MNIIKLLIAAAIIGVFVVFLLTRYNNQNMNKISELKQGQTERIIGMINSVYVSKSGHVFLKVADTSGEVSVIAFNNSNIDGIYDLTIGDQISVIGKVESYKGKLEIIAKDIKRV